MEETFNNAANYGRLEEVKTLLREQPSLDVNWKSQSGHTALHRASHNGHWRIVKLLLAHPAIDVNVKNVDGIPPFSYACENGHTEVLRVLLKDPRVDTTLVDDYEHTPLWQAARSGHREVIAGFIASERDLGDLEKKGEWEEEYHTAIEIATLENNTEVVTLLESFRANPTQTRHDVRVELGVLDEVAAEIFALTIFLCDDLLRLNSAALASIATSDPTTAATAVRFFVIAKKVPMELQMILCRRVVGSVKDNILSKDSEAAFKSLTEILRDGL